MKSTILYPFTRTKKDLYLQSFIVLNGFFSSLFVLFILLFLLKESSSLIGVEGLSFLWDRSWYPLEGQYNIIPMLAASFLLCFGAILIALPFGIFTAFFEQYYLSEKTKIIFRRILELTTGIPSVIFGFWGIMKLVPWINQYHPPGQSLLAGILILTLMVFPIISLNLIASIESTNKRYQKASEALGMSKESYIWKVVFPVLKPSLASSSVIAIGRALGETMAVLMVCGNIVAIPKSVFEPVRSLTANIALEMSYAVGDHRSALFVSGLILFLFVSFLFLIKEFFNEKERA